MSERTSGIGPWRIYWHAGQPVRVEIDTGAETFAFGSRPYRSGCARCGAAIQTSTPDNAEMDVCGDCEQAILAGADD